MPHFISIMPKKTDKKNYPLRNHCKISNKKTGGWVNRFWFALENNDHHVVKQILSQNIDVNHVFKQHVHNQRIGQTAIFIAVRKNSKDLVSSIIRAGCDLEHMDAWGETPLFLAVRRGRITMIKQLINAGSNINHQNHNGETVLFLTIANGRKDLVEYIISQKINLDLTNRNGSTALILTFEILLDSLCINTHGTRRRTPSNLKEISELIIPLASNLNLAHPMKGTPLRLALTIETFHSRENLFLSRLLLQHGAIPDRLFFLRFGGLNATTTQPGSEFFTPAFFGLSLEAGACIQREKTWLTTVLMEMPQELAPYEMLFHELLEKSLTPMSLQTICQISIRQILGGPLWKKIDALPIPNTLKNFLKLKHFFHEKV